VSLRQLYAVSYAKEATMSDYTNITGKVPIHESRLKPAKDWQDTFVFLATGVGYAANLAALILLVARFLKPGPADSAAAWRFIGSFCLAALAIGLLILVRRQGFRVRMTVSKKR
jgi:hypothetical protein